jgi:hypothetical protein
VGRWIEGVRIGGMGVGVMIGGIDVGVAMGGWDVEVSAGGLGDGEIVGSTIKIVAV